MRQNQVRGTGRPARPAFTLIELLVVISIIAILMTLSAAAAFKVLSSQYSKITRDLITRIDSRLKAQNSFVLNRIAISVPVTTTASSMSNGDANRAKVIHIKFLAKQWFPMTFAEALSGGGPGYPAKPAYVSYLAQYGITTGNTPALPHESAACLYMILQHGPETAGEEDLGLTANTKVINGIPCLVDAWGQPLVFCRWPTGDLGAGGTGVSPVNPAGAQAGPPYVDPVDPQGLLAAQSWLSSAGAGMFLSALHPLPPRQKVGSTTRTTGASLNLSPVIVSSGPDKQLGLDPLTLQLPNPDLGLANDNLYNR
jgi:prepilin-type N-terminal cleavage/methylation domain-containing protein